MKPRQCPNCSELAKIDDKFCPKCRMVLSYDAILETGRKVKMNLILTLSKKP